MSLNCQHLYHSKGFRSKGGYYLPMDEPGDYCLATGYQCQVSPIEPCAEDCEVWEELTKKCPNCEDVFLVKNGMETIFCPNCGDVFIDS